jgi:hypothetical protein
MRNCASGVPHGGSRISSAPRREERRVAQHPGHEKQPRLPALLDHQTLDGTAEITNDVGEPRHGETSAIGADPGFSLEHAIRIGTGVGIASAAQATNAAGGEPCCMLGSQGPAALGLVVARLPTTRKIASIKSFSRKNRLLGKSYFVPNMRSPASPRPGTM